MSILDNLKKYFSENSTEKIQEDWDKTEHFDNGLGLTIEDFLLYAVSKPFYCQSQIEGNGWCEEQCDHCKEYYKPLEQ